MLIFIFLLEKKFKNKLMLFPSPLLASNILIDLVLASYLLTNSLNNV